MLNPISRLLHTLITTILQSCAFLAWHVHVNPVALLVLKIEEQRESI